MHRIWSLLLANSGIGSTENCHDRSAEDFLFFRFRKAHRPADLVTTLLEQHQSGRFVTRRMRRLVVVCDRLTPRRYTIDVTAGRDTGRVCLRDRPPRGGGEPQGPRRRKSDQRRGVG